MSGKTHREIKVPTMSARYLADYMAATDTGRRSILSACKYQSQARLIQHDEARSAVGRYLRGSRIETAALVAKADELRNRMADSEFDRDQLDTNADYIARFAGVASSVELPIADVEAPGSDTAFMLGGVRVKPQLVLRLRRRTKSNKMVVGAATLRYAKGRSLYVAVAQWQSAFISGFLKATIVEDEVSPDPKLCLTIDAYAGIAHSSPTDAVRRFRNMEAACEAIAERWPALPPPKGAIL